MYWRHFWRNQAEAITAVREKLAQRGWGRYVYWRGNTFWVNEGWWLRVEGFITNDGICLVSCQGWLAGKVRRFLTDMFGEPMA
jgi:hypothetical protein